MGSDWKEFFDEQEFSFHQLVSERYLEMAANGPQQWLVADATLPQGRKWGKPSGRGSANYYQVSR